MRTLLGLAIVILFFSCGKNSAVSKKLAGSDSLVITFNRPNTDAVINIVQTNNKKAIKKLIGFMGGEDIKKYDCGYDGHILFFREGKQIMAVVFKYTGSDCRHFLYDIDNVVTSAKMGNEAADFLTSLAEGRNWY